MCMHMCACTYTCVHVHTHAYICIHVRTSAHVYMCMHMCVCAYAFSERSQDKESSLLFGFRYMLVFLQTPGDWSSGPDIDLSSSSYLLTWLTPPLSANVQRPPPGRKTPCQRFGQIFGPCAKRRAGEFCAKGWPRCHFFGFLFGKKNGKIAQFFWRLKGKFDLWQGRALTAHQLFFDLLSNHHHPSRRTEVSSRWTWWAVVKYSSSQLFCTYIYPRK